MVEAICGSAWLERMAVSSANVPVIIFCAVGRSDVYKTYSTGPRTLPCGTPEQEKMPNMKFFNNGITKVLTSYGNIPNSLEPTLRAREYCQKESTWHFSSPLIWYTVQQVSFLRLLSVSHSDCRFCKSANSQLLSLDMRRNK
jgi:hypothetical protein